MIAPIPFHQLPAINHPGNMGTIAGLQILWAVTIAIIIAVIIAVIAFSSLGVEPISGEHILLAIRTGMAMGICLHVLMWIFSPIHLPTCILHYFPHSFRCPFVAALSPYSVTALLIALLPYSVNAPLLAPFPYFVTALLLAPSYITLTLTFSVLSNPDPQN
jgi:hypothetical protein